MQFVVFIKKRVHCHMQRMGGVNGIVISSDGQYTMSVGQERRLIYWNNTQLEPSHSQFLEGELDEGRCIAKYGCEYSFIKFVCLQ